MVDQPRKPPYQVLLSEGAEQDLGEMRAAAEQEKRRFPNDKTPAKNAHRMIYKEALREVYKLEAGTSNGHHVLGAHRLLGDGRDIVVSKLNDGTGKLNKRLTMREIPARNAGGVNAREVIAIGDRHGVVNAYAHTAERLGRTAGQTLPELDRFGDVQVSSGGKAHQRHPVLDAHRAIAHAFDGQKPLTGSRPLSETEFGERATTGSTRDASRIRDTPQQGK